MVIVGRASLRSRFGACLRRIQIAERNEAERGQAGEDRLFTRREVKWSALNRTESGRFGSGSRWVFSGRNAAAEKSASDVELKHPSKISYR